MKTSQQSTSSDFNQATSQPMMRNAGFALVIALSMMSFVLVLILSFTVMVTVETTNSSRAKQQLLARENARLGMLIAVGKLQQIAGPDERAMARAEAFESNSTSISNGQWLGIIDANTPTNDLAEINWLTSQDEADPILPSEVLNDSNSAIIIPSIETTQGTSIPEVRVPLVDITDSTQQFAYWVSDESMKASIATSPEIDGQDSDWLEDTFGASNAKRLDQVIPKRTGVEMLFTSNDLDSTAIYRELNKINSLKQLPLATAWDMANFTDFFHDITDRTYGVLASTTGSGLRKDLSLRPDLMPIPGAFVSANDYSAYMEEPLASFSSQTPYIPYEEGPRRRYEITAPSTTTPGEIIDGIYPVITDFMVLLHVHVAGDDVVNQTALSSNPILDKDEIVVRAQIQVELWNPYTSALVPENLVLEINDLPDVTITFPGARGQSITHTISLDDAFSTPETGGDGFFIELPFDDRGYSNHDDKSWLPGRIYNWIGPNNFSGGSSKGDSMAKFYERGLSNAIWYAGTGITAPISASSFGLSAAESNFKVALRQKSTGGQLHDGPELSRVEDINYSSFDTGGGFDREDRALSFGYRIQRDESGFVQLSSDPWDKSRWLRVEDPRNPRPVFDNTGYGVGAFQAPNGLDPTGYTATGISQSSFLFDRTAGGTGLRPSEDIPVFEAFRQRPISMGELQHLQIINERPFTIGNSWGSDGSRRYNRIFDEAYFSGLATSDTSPDLSADELFPNHRLRTTEGIANNTALELNDILAAEENSAQFFLSEGAFNINSTSASAWAALLGSMYLEEWEIANINDTNGDIIETTPTRTTDIGQAILRFPQSAQEVFHTGVYKDLYEPPTEFFRVGAKHLTDTTTNENDTTPFTKLSEAIVTRLKERIQSLGPYTSLEEFLSPVELPLFQDPNSSAGYLSLLERAIQDVSGLNTTTAKGDVWHHTSSFLSQADVMTGIAPVANVRGDTFYIRSVGMSQDGLNSDNQITVVCEATVQRIPQAVDSNDDIIQPDENGFGRQFLITDIRWIQAQEL